MSINQINNIGVNEIGAINNISLSSVSEVINVGYSAPAESFADSYAASKSITTGLGQTIRIADTNGKFNFTHSDAYSISFWVKAGWSSSLNSNIHLFTSNSNPSSSYENLIRFYYNESNNRFYFQYSSSSPTYYSQNFWLMHSNSGNYAAAYQASGLGSSYWSATNRGNVGDDDFTLLTICKSATNNAGGNYTKLYWNGTSMGLGYYANGNSNGTPNMTTVDRQIVLGSNAWTYAKSGNSTETQFNDLSWWNKQLSASEVAEIYNNGARMDLTTHSAATNLKGYYKFENNGVDSSGNSGNPFVFSGNSNLEAI
jgi:hypothetical protein